MALFSLLVEGRENGINKVIRSVWRPFPLSLDANQNRKGEKAYHRRITREGELTGCVAISGGWGAILEQTLTHFQLCLQKNENERTKERRGGDWSMSGEGTGEYPPYTRT